MTGDVLVAMVEEVALAVGRGAFLAAEVEVVVVAVTVEVTVVVATKVFSLA